MANWLSYGRCSRPLNETFIWYSWVIRSYIHLYGLDISIKASRRYHGSHQKAFNLMRILWLLIERLINLNKEFSLIYINKIYNINVSVQIASLNSSHNITVQIRKMILHTNTYHCRGMHFTILLYHMNVRALCACHRLRQIKQFAMEHMSEYL